MSRNTLVQILGFVGVIALYILLGYVLWRYLDWYIDPDSAREPSTAKKDLFQALGFLLAGTAGVIGIYFTWRNLSISQATLQSTRESQALEREGQALERFGKAVELLGASDDAGTKSIEARVAGIYTLEGIAKGSPAQFVVIVNILNSYIRNNAARPRGDLSNVLEKEFELSQDVQVSVNALSNLNALTQTPGLAVSIDLSDTDLRGVQLIGASLVGVNLGYAVLRGAALLRANLNGANLMKADLREAYLYEANLSQAYLYEANLSEANLSRAYLSEAYLSEAYLSEAYLSGADLSGADLSGADLSGAQITEEQLGAARSLQRAVMPDGSVHD